MVRSLGLLCFGVGEMQGESEWRNELEQLL